MAYDYRLILKIIVLCTLWYASSSGNNVTAKQILGVFPYPMTLTMIHMLILNCLLGPVLNWLGVPPTPHLSRKFYIKRLIPLAIGKLIGGLMSHFSLWRVPVSYAHTIKALMPFFTVIFSHFILKESYSWKVYLSLMPIVGGVLMATVTELSFDLLGLICASLSTLCFSLQNIYSKKSMREVHVHHLRLLLVLTQISTILLFPFWMYTDVWNIITNIHEIKYITWLLLILPLGGVFSFLQSIMAFSLLSVVSPVSYSVASATKRIVVITVSLLMLKNPVTSSNVCGMAVAISGVILYNKIKLNAKDKSPILPQFVNNGHATLMKVV